MKALTHIVSQSQSGASLSYRLRASLEDGSCSTDVLVEVVDFTGGEQGIRATLRAAVATDLTALGRLDATGNPVTVLDSEVVLL